MNTIAYVIPHRGRVDYLAITLDSITGLARTDGESREIVVVTQDRDRSKVESVVAAADARSAEGRCRLLSADPERTISASRNLGAARTDSEFLAFLDADVELSSNWAAAMLRTLRERPATVVVSAVQRVEPAASALERLRCELGNLATDAEVPFLPGRNLLMRRETFDAIGGFPEHLESCEDYWFTDRARRFGTLFYSSAASYVHTGEDREWSGLFGKELWRAKSNLDSLRDRSIGWREYPSLLVPPGVLIGMIGTVVGLVAGAPAVIGTSLVVVFMPIVAYVFRLWKGSEGRISLTTAVRFYLTYFPARAIGMLVGLGERLSGGRPR